MNNKRRVIVFTAALLSSAVMCLDAASWTSFQKNPSRTGEALEYAYPKLSPVWSYDVQGAFFASPVVYDGTVFAGARDGSVWAWRAPDGEVVWQQSTSGWVDAAPCVWKNRVIALSRDGKVYCFDRADGEIVWTLATGNANVSSPVVYKDVLYFMSGSPGSDVVGLNPADGSAVVRITLSQYGFSSPSIDGNTLIVGTNDGKINVVNLDTRQVNSLSTYGGIKYITPAIKNSRIFASVDGDERRIFALDIAGNTLWQTPQLSDKPMSASSVSVGDNFGYVTVSSGAQTQVLVKFSLADGTTQWCIDVGRPSSLGKLPEPVIVNDLIYIVSGDGYLRILTSGGMFVEPFGGNVVAASTGVWLGSEAVAPCVVSGGKIFVGTQAGRFWAFDCEKKVSINYPDEYDVVVNSAVVRAAIKDLPSNDYVVEYKRIDGTDWTQIVSGNSSPSDDLNAATWSAAGCPDGQYYVRITANNSISKRAVSKFTLDNSPPPPTAVTASDTPFDSGGSITLAWTKSADDGAGNKDVAGYRIYRSTSFAGNYTAISTVAAGATSFEDKGLPNQTTYYYKMKSYDATGDSAYFSNVASAYAMVDGKLVQPGSSASVVLALTDGTTVEVSLSADSLVEPAYIGIRIPPSFSDEGIPSSAKKTSRVYEFGATSLAGKKIERFAAPVTIKIPYLPSDVAGMNEENLRLYRFDEEKNKWGAVNTSVADIPARKVSAAVPRFSIYRIMEYLAGREELISEDKIYAYPNPARFGKVYFKYFLGDKADVRIDVYNVAGELVARLERASNPAGIVSEIEWDVSGVASGVYVWRLEARSASGAKSAKKKVAVIN